MTYLPHMTGKRSEDERRKAEEKYDEVWKISNKVILENRKVFDTLTVIISIGILANLFAFGEIVTADASFDFSKCLFFTILVLSCLSLIFCVVSPAYGMHKRKKLQKELTKLLLEEYTAEDVIDLEKKYNKTLEERWGIFLFPSDFARVVLLVFIIAISTIFYSGVVLWC